MLSRKYQGVKAKKSQYITQPFVITADDLARLYSSILEFTDQIQAEIVSVDGIDRKFYSLADLLQFEHPPSKDIQLLRIYAFSDDITVWLRFDKRRYYNINRDIEGSEENVNKLTERIDDRLAAMRPWYSMIARISMSWVVSAILVLLLVRNSLVVSSIQNSGVAGTIALFLLGLLGPALLGTLLDRVAAPYFPMGVFAIGQGAKRHSDREIIRTVVVLGFMISLLAGLAQTLLSQSLVPSSPVPHLVKQHLQSGDVTQPC